MTASETHPDGISLAEPSEGSRIRPVDRRVIQAIALVCAVSALLAVQWADETHSVRKNLKPPEKVTTVPEGQIGELVGAKWKVYRRQKAEPLRRTGDVVELRLLLAVRPADAASAKAVGSYDLAYRLRDDEGREWSATGLRTGQPTAGVAMGITVKGTVPRSMADSLEREIRAPTTSRKPGSPLPSLRFSH